ncbi:MAG: hypothetical protein D6732_08445, partial [Methanobacteriota archaeon]
IFAVMGAGVAFIWEETNLKKAFYLGLGLPAFIQMGTGEISSVEATAFQQLTPPAAISSRLYAHGETSQDFHIVTASMQQDSVRTLTITLEKYVPKYVIEFASQDEVLEKVVRNRPNQLSQSFEVPHFANQFRLKVVDSFSLPQPLPAEPGNYRYRVTLRESFWKGFFQAIGFRKDVGMEIIITREE